MTCGTPKNGRYKCPCKGNLCTKSCKNGKEPYCTSNGPLRPIPSDPCGLYGKHVYCTSQCKGCNTGKCYGKSMPWYRNAVNLNNSDSFIKKYPRKDIKEAQFKKNKNILFDGLTIKDGVIKKQKKPAYYQLPSEKNQIGSFVESSKNWKILRWNWHFDKRVIKGSKGYQYSVFYAYKQFYDLSGNKNKSKELVKTQNNDWTKLFSDEAYTYGLIKLTRKINDDYFRKKKCPFLVFTPYNCNPNEWNPIDCKATCIKPKKNKSKSAVKAFGLKKHAIQNLLPKNDYEFLVRDIDLNKYLPYQGRWVKTNSSSKKIKEKADGEIEAKNVNSIDFKSQVGENVLSGPWLPQLDSSNKVKKTVKLFNGFKCVNDSQPGYQTVKPANGKSNAKKSDATCYKKPRLFDTSFHAVKCSLDFGSDEVRGALGAANTNSSSFEGYKVFYNTKTKDVIPYFMAATDSNQSKKLFQSKNWTLLQRVKSKNHLLKDGKYLNKCKKIGTVTEGYQTYHCKVKKNAKSKYDKTLKQQKKNRRVPPTTPWRIAKGLKM